MKITRNHSFFSIIIWLVVYFIGLLLILFPIFTVSKGIVYPLDDVYIHLSIAKNLLYSFTWGLYPNENISASSSPLYTLLLSPFTSSTSIANYAPLLVNIGVSIGLLFLLHTIFQKLHLSFSLQLIGGIVFILLVPLPSLSVMGMEHLLHSLFVILILNRILFTKNNKWILPFLTTIALFIRLESAFVIVGIISWSLLEKKWDILQQMIVGLSIGICLYFSLSLTFSISIIPNTILLKTIISEQSFLLSTIDKVWNSKLLLSLTILGLITLLLRWKNSKIFLIVFVSTFLHLILAKQGWFYRYEAYLLVLFFVIFVFEFHKDFLVKKNVITICIAILFVTVSCKRAYLSLTTTALASKNIYDQQIQMAMMLFPIAPTQTIAVNDIGAVSFFTSHHYIDLYGIATKEVFDLKKSKQFTADNIQRLIKMKNTSIVCVYSSWFENSTFDTYKLIKTIHLDNNVVCGDTIVSFYTVQKQDSLLPVTFP